ncbi:MAG: 2-amino-4-hydroxy-6-hydroxymethyldihydropteridine diphosphokinase [Leptospiraceae bacterium]
MTEHRQWIPSYLSLGSNIENRQAHMAHAEYLINRNPKINIQKKSQILDNPPLLVENQPPFLNQVFLTETQLGPYELLDTLKDYENQIGRIKRIRFGPREIDLDILSYGQLRLDSDRLTIPHPALRDREYLRILLAEFDTTPEDLLNQATRSEI